MLVRCSCRGENALLKDLEARPIVDDPLMLLVVVAEFNKDVPKREFLEILNKWIIDSIEI